MRRAIAWIPSSFVAVLALEAPARAEPAIHWSAPPECPSEDALRAALGGLRTGNGDGHVEATIVDVQIDRQEARYRLRLDVRDADGTTRERTISGETCDAVVDAAAVALAIALDDSAAAEPAARDVSASGREHAPETPASTPPSASKPPSHAPPPTSAQGAPAKRHEADARERPERPPGAMRWDLGAFAGADFVSLPSPTPGFGIGVNLEVAGNVIAARASAWIPEHATLASHPSAGGDVGLVVGELRYERSLFPGLFDLLPFAGFEAGALLAQGSGVTTSKLGVGAWLAPSAGFVAALRPSRGFALTLECQGLALLVRPKFEISAGGEVYQPPPATVRTLLGLHARWP